MRDVVCQCRIREGIDFLWEMRGLMRAPLITRCAGASPPRGKRAWVAVYHSYAFCVRVLFDRSGIRSGATGGRGKPRPYKDD